MFIMSLAVADLTVGCFVMPISSAYALTGEESESQGRRLIKTISLSCDDLPSSISFALFPCQRKNFCSW